MRISITLHYHLLGPHQELDTELKALYTIHYLISKIKSRNIK